MKPALYAAAGTAHYWRLELDPAPRLCLGRLEHGGCTDRLVQAGDTTALTEPFPFDIDPPGWSTDRSGLRPAGRRHAGRLAAYGRVVRARPDPDPAPRTRLP
ncbi:hypothetical protein [Streptomyces sp. NPDC051567]|uniref:hypothetical protein n=1 Tax=Streptomyces sp. NPDC051567 TaxID=3365660 RepID=UPI0037A78EF5